MWMRSGAIHKALLHKLRLRDSLRCRCGWVAWVIGVREIKEVVVAKVIEFYIPTRFRRPLKTAPRAQFGKIVEFCPPAKKSAWRHSRYNAESACKHCEVVFALACSCVHSN
jgi:hypothetical protein